jgi:hypothetical protein
MPNEIRRERLSIGTSLALAIVAFPPVLAVAAIVVGKVVISIVDDITVPGADIPHALDAILQGAMIGLPVLVAYIVSRFIYTNLRWRWEEPDGQYCRACAYDLTGNVSGVCPECGTPVGDDTAIDTNG